MKLHGEQRITPDELLITPKDAFCVQIAALCHDLGQYMHATKQPFIYYLLYFS